MKIGGPSAPTAPGLRRTAASGPFAAATDAAERAAAPPAAASPGGVGGLDALLALQELGGPLERRRRALARGGRVLDDLDRVRLALLDGDDRGAALDALARTAAAARERADDAGLDDVLDAIDLRAAVELAKAERRPSA